MAQILKGNEVADYTVVRLLALDPASHLTGYAYFESHVTGIQLVQFGNIKAPRKDSFDMRCFVLNSKIRSFIVEKQCTDLVMEFPEFQDGSKGTSAARGGATLTLAFLCGSIATGWQLHMAEVMKQTNSLMLDVATLITPSKWKGQLKKAVTAQRCEKKYGVKARGEVEFNYSDAIMLGDYVMANYAFDFVQQLVPERKDY